MMRLLKLLLIVLFVIMVVPALAQNGYPEAQNSYVNDFAGVLDNDTEQGLSVMLEDLRSGRGIEMTVVTIGSTSAYSVDADSFEDFATGLFNTWGIGSAEDANGVLLLVAVNDRHVRIEVGRSYERTLNDDMQTVIDTYILPAFRENDYNKGVYEGTRNAIFQITGTMPADTRPFNIGALISSVMGAVFSPIGLVILIVGAWIILMIRRAMNGELLFSGGHTSAYSDSSSSSSWASSSSDSSSSSSSSSSDFGGGDSSGGGASGDW
jgi:uncharacterized protein